ncbi:MAG: hypothetical protein R2863_03030 [Candidatus Kapaibacterium sp.]
MKKIILLIAIMAFVGCKEETPTEQKVNIDKKYTLDELENDPDWVEVTDIDTVSKNPCINLNLATDGILIRNEKDYDSLETESISKYGEYSDDSCIFNFNDFNIDTTSKSIILFATRTNVGPKVTRKIFKHKIQNILIYYNEIERVSGNEGNNIYRDLISIPKTDSTKFIIVKIKF